jgi:7-cyano-7-deazaguanine synthase
MKNKKNVVVSLSGGMDSAALCCFVALKEYDSVTAISFDYGQKHQSRARTSSIIE